MTEWETAPAVAETPEIKLFGKWSTDDVQINDISLQVAHKWCTKRTIKFELKVLCFSKRGLESHLDIDQLALCARALVEELVSVYSLAVVWCDPVNHRLRHTLPTWCTLMWLVLLEFQWPKSARFPTGLHCREREVRQVPATLWRTLCRQAFPQGPVPHCGASDQLHDDARPQQRQEADDCPHRQARFWDHPPADGRGMQLGLVVWGCLASKSVHLKCCWVLSDEGSW